MTRIPSQTAATTSRIAILLAFAGLTAFGSLGCQTAKPKTDGPQTISSTNPPPSDPSAPKTEFRKDVTHDQEYNVHVELGRVYETQGNNEAAVVEYQKAVDVCEKKGSVLGGSKLSAEQQSLAQRRMAEAFDRMGRFAQSEVHYQKALKLTPRDPKVWNSTGYSLYLQNRWADAVRAYKTADSISPNEPKVLTNLGFALAAQGKNEEALAALTRAGGPAVAHANLGYILAAMGKTEEARHHYAAALTIQPALTAAGQALAKLDAQSKPSAASLAATLPLPKPVDNAVKASAKTNVTAPVAVRQTPAAPGGKDSMVTRTSASDRMPLLPPNPVLPTLSR